MTASTQRQVRRFEELAGGTYKPCCAPEAVERELERVQSRQQKLQAALELMGKESPALEAVLGRVVAQLST